MATRKTTKVIKMVPEELAMTITNDLPEAQGPVMEDIKNVPVGSVSDANDTPGYNIYPVDIYVRRIHNLIGRAMVISDALLLVKKLSKELPPNKYRPNLTKMADETANIIQELVGELRRSL